MATWWDTWLPKLQVGLSPDSKPHSVRIDVERRVLETDADLTTRSLGTQPKTTPAHGHHGEIRQHRFLRFGGGFHSHGTRG